MVRLGESMINSVARTLDPIIALVGKNPLHGFSWFALSMALCRKCCRWSVRPARITPA
jgi:hypothetical protein